MRPLLFLCVICGIVNVDACADIYNLLQDTIVVRGCVSEVQIVVDVERPGLVSYAITIEHLYSGEVGALNGPFKFAASDLSQHSGGGLSREINITPALRVGEELFWLLRLESDQLIPMFDYHFGVVWPVRSTGSCDGCGNGGSIFADTIDPDAPNPQFPRVRLLAESLEKVWDADTETKRVELLKSYTQSGTTEVSLMAVELLHMGAPQAFRQYVADSNLLTLPLKSQLAVDEAMLSIDKHDWKVSNQRKKMIQGWTVLAHNADDAEVLQLLGWLESAARQGDIDAPSVLKVLHPILTGDPRLRADALEFPILLRIKAVIVLQAVTNSPDIRRQAFPLLTTLLDEEVDIRLRRSAAMVLAKFDTFTPEEIVALESWRNVYAELAENSETRYNPAREIATILDGIIQRDYGKKE